MVLSIFSLLQIALSLLADFTYDPNPGHVNLPCYFVSTVLRASVSHIYFLVCIVKDDWDEPHRRIAIITLLALKVAALKLGCWETGQLSIWLSLLCLTCPIILNVLLLLCSRLRLNWMNMSPQNLVSLIFRIVFVFDAKVT